MKKVVINACYGGFSISTEALVLIAKKQGKKVFFYSDAGDTYREVPYEEAISNDSLFGIDATIIPTLEEYVAFKLFDWNSANDKQREQHNNDYDRLFLNNRPSCRHDELLVEVVEELGTKKASGDCAELKIVEIPIDEYLISDHDGWEEIAEPHRTWS